MDHEVEDQAYLDQWRAAQEVPPYPVNYPWEQDVRVIEAEPEG